MHALSGGESGRTVIGALPLARSYLLPAALLEFTQEHPRHGVAIIEGTYEHLLAGLRSGESDILIGALRDPAPAADVLQEHLFDDPLAIIVRAGHPLVRRRRVTAAALGKFQWIAPRAGSPLRVHFNALLASTGLELPSPPLECNSLAAARAFLLESDRIMLLSAHQIHYEMQAGLLVALPHPAGKVVRPIGLTLRRNWHPTSTQQQIARNPAPKRARRGRVACSAMPGRETGKLAASAQREFPVSGRHCVLIRTARQTRLDACGCRRRPASAKRSLREAQYRHHDPLAEPARKFQRGLAPRSCDARRAGTTRRSARSCW